VIPWHTYDDIAGRYEEVCGTRFESAAELLVSRLQPRAGGRALDVGTGTGAVLRVLNRRHPGLGMLVGCDLSGPMLAQARQQITSLHAVQCDITRLPFRSNSFDQATAGFVLSHVPDYRLVLKEVFRVLRPSSLFGAASWAPTTDPYVGAWRELLGAAVEASLIERATDEALPWEAHFEAPQRVRSALVEAGFAEVRVEIVQIELILSIAEFMADRQIGAAGRYARVVLGQLRWQEFVETARASLESRFGPRIAYRRDVVLGVGIRV
jgi:ubiquinone/menaquinone biosynthesis C-methylase UbiE